MTDFLYQLSGPLTLETASNEVVAIQSMDSITNEVRENIGSLLESAGIVAAFPVTIPAGIADSFVPFQFAIALGCRAFQGLGFLIP